MSSCASCFLDTPAASTRASASAEPFDAGLLHLAPVAVQLTAAGWYPVRAVASVIDQHLHTHPAGAQF